MTRIITSLWYDNNAEEAANFYLSVFKNSEILDLRKQGEEDANGDGSVLVVNFRLDEQEFIAFNGGPYFKFSEAISLTIDCKDQEEVDYYWSKLSEGGEESQCGWLKDKFGLSWQVVPRRLNELILDDDRTKSDRVVAAMLKMGKIDVATLEAAYNLA